MRGSSTQGGGRTITTVNHIFVDFENIQPAADEIAAANSPDVRLWILHGAHQHDFSADRVRAWQPMGDRVFFAQSSKTGPNAVDMLLAFCLGEAYNVDRSAWQPARYFIVSQDKDFDALFLHMKRLGMVFHRVPSLSKALSLIPGKEPTVSAAQPKKQTKSTIPVAPRAQSDVDRVIEDIRKNARNRPKRRKTLEHKIQSFLGTKAAPAKIQAIIIELERRGVIRFDETKVLYEAD